MSEIKDFKNLGIETKQEGFAGDKLPFYHVFNQEIIINKYKIVPSNFKEKSNGLRLDMQITYEGRERLIWTSSVNLQDTIQKINPEDFPIRTTIVKENQGYKFT